MKKLIQRLALAGTLALATVGVYSLGKSSGFRQGYGIGKYDQCRKLGIAFYIDGMNHLNDSADILKVKSPMPNAKYYDIFDPTGFVLKAVESGNLKARDEAMIGSSFMNAAIECRNQAHSMISHEEVPYVPEMDQLKQRYIPKK